MKPANDYPVYFQYGATSSPYNEASPHRGEDRCNKLGVPILVSGVQIGLTGFTGKVEPANPAGAHLHVQEWSGKYSNTRKPQNTFKPGLVTNVDLDGTQGDGSFGKFITIQNADGWNDSYCHLSQIDVHVGQNIGDNVATKADRDAVRYLWEGFLDRQPTEDEYTNLVGKDLDDVLHTVYTSDEYAKRKEQLVTQYVGWKTLNDGFDEVQAYLPKG